MIIDLPTNIQKNKPIHNVNTLYTLCSLSIANLLAKYKPIYKSGRFSAEVVIFLMKSTPFL